MVFTLSVHRTLRVFWIKHIILAREISLGGGRLQVKEQGSLPRKFQTPVFSTKVHCMQFLVYHACFRDVMQLEFFVYS